MRFRLLGGLEVLDGDRRLDAGGPKQRAVLAVLLLDTGTPVSTDRLVERTWGDSPPARAEASLQSYVSNLRRLLEPERRAREAPSVLVTRGAGYALLVDADRVDLHRATGLVADGRRALDRGDADVAAATLDEALEALRRPLLPELADEPWVVEAAARVAAARAEALDGRIDAALALGRPGEAVGLAEEAVALDPYRERARARLALALYRDGRQRDALTALAEARQVLADDIGIEPGRELRELEQDVLAQDPSLDGPRPDPGDRPEAPAREATLDEGQVASDDEGDAGPTGDGLFVGRRRELGLALDALEGARRGPGRPLVVSGEPGIGKTRLVTELAHRAGDRLVLWARCPESGAQAAYWPLVQVVRQLVDAGVTGPALDALVLATSADDGNAEPLARHMAVAEALAGLDVPVVVVVDDLQWADAGTLRLLEFVAGELRRTRLLLVATVRPVGADSPTVLVDCVAELARQPGALRLDLSGLTADDVAAWIGHREGTVASGIAELVHDRSGGNAFFVGEVVELLAAEEALDDADRARRRATVPAAVHDVVRRRVGRLPGPTQQLLSAASVVGRTFDVDVLAGVVGEDVLDVLDELEPALGTGLVVEQERPGCFQFAHALVADALSSELSPGRRARLHAATARTLARLRGTGSDEEMASMAHHAVAGTAAGTAPEAYEWSVRAARFAATRGAHLDAAQHWRRAADASRMAMPHEVGPRFEALLEAGRALLRVDMVGDAYVLLVEAIELALAGGDPGMVGPAAAAMSIGGLWVAGEVGLVAVDAVGTLRRAIAALPPTPTTDRALALGALAENGYWTMPPEEVESLAAEALAGARALGDRSTHVRSLEAVIKSTWRAGMLPQRQSAAAELLEVVEGASLPDEVRAGALYGVASVRWEEGDVAATRALVDDGARLAQQAAAPALITQLGFFRASLAYHAGEVGDALERIVATQDLHRRTRGWGSEGIGSSYKAACWMEIGDLDSIVAAEGPVLESPYGMFFGEFHGLAYTLAGASERADRILTGLPPLVDSWLYLGLTVAAAHNRASLGRTDEARVVHQHLLPFSGRVATPGTGPMLGDVDLALARLERLLGDRTAADAHLDASVELLARVGSVPWLARALLLRHEWRGDEADLARASALVEGTDLHHLRETVAGRQAGPK